MHRALRGTLPTASRYHESVLVSFLQRPRSSSLRTTNASRQVGTNEGCSLNRARLMSAHAAAGDGISSTSGTGATQMGSREEPVAIARNERRWNRGGLSGRAVFPGSLHALIAGHDYDAHVVPSAASSLATSMERFHNYFKAEFNLIYELADGSFTKRGMSLKLYLAEVTDFKQHLTAHHTIEERHIFPVLAKRMPTFQNDDIHIKSHHGIHEGLDKLGELTRKWHEEPSTYSPREMKECLDSWKEVLFTHLDQEVKDLSGENMKKYWTLEEVDGILI